ncbi:hypothetical protein TNCV_905571 [Trichonephila clavipes]|nr:hypothetical protein TNCV_905571 [Trichonephila clavipes]
METLEVLSHLATLRCQDPFLGDWEHDLVKEYRSDGERYVARQSPTEWKRNMPPRQKRVAASTITCTRLRQAETQISPFSPPYAPPFPTNITAKCSKQEVPAINLVLKEGP